MPVYVIILALALLCRAGDLAHATWSDVQDGKAERAAQEARSGGVDLTIDQSFVDSVYARTIDEGFRRALERAFRDSGHRGCGCSPDRSGGQAGAAGF